MKNTRYADFNLLLALIALTVLSVSGAAPVAAQIPDEFTNLQVLPKDIKKDDLMTVMRDFSFALDVRCQYCHAGGDGVSFKDVDFASDDDPDKKKARFMMRMTDNLNREILPSIPERGELTVMMQCKTCHRGRSKPLLLTQELRLVLDENGAEAAVARYRELREEFGHRGAFDFGQWEVNTLAEKLADEGRTRDAIAIYELNATVYDESTSIPFSLGKLYESLGEKDKAIESYQRVLELRPGNRRAQERLDALRTGGG